MDYRGSTWKIGKLSLSLALAGAMMAGCGKSSSSNGGDGDGDGDGDSVGDGDTAGDGDGDNPGDGDGDNPGDGDGDNPGDGDGDNPGDGDGDNPGDGDGDNPGDGDGDGTGGTGGTGTGGMGGDDGTGGATGGMGMGGQGGGSFVSDDFDGPLGDHWTFINPLSDCSLTELDSAVEIVIPSGTSHDMWVGGPTSPQLVQSVADDDFFIQAVFNTLPSTHIQAQGIVALSDSDTFVRADVFYEQGEYHLFFAAVDGAGGDIWEEDFVVPTSDTLYLRLKREGHLWSFDWSSDGVTYSDPLTRSYVMPLTRLGVFAGNFADNPATTVQIDRVENLL